MEHFFCKAGSSGITGTSKMSPLVTNPLNEGISIAPLADHHQPQPPPPHHQPHHQPQPPPPPAEVIPLQKALQCPACPLLDHSSQISHTSKIAFPQAALMTSPAPKSDAIPPLLSKM